MDATKNTKMTIPQRQLTEASSYDRDSVHHQLVCLPKNQLCLACKEAKVKTETALRNTGNLREKFPNVGGCITSGIQHATDKHPTAGHSQERSAVTSIEVGIDFNGAHAQVTKKAD